MYPASKHAIRTIFRLVTAVVISAPVFLAGWSVSVRAQPAPSLIATCGSLRESLRTFHPDDGDLVVIEVTGVLKLAETDGVLAYMGVCGGEDPKVMCITYKLNGYRAGDRVTVTGSFKRLDDDYVQLDPCLGSAPDRED